MNSLSKGTRAKLQKAFSVLTGVTTVLSLSGVAYLAPVAALAVAPADYGLKEGDVVSAAGSDDPDVYIVNEMGYKRLFLNPAIFNFYGHLGGFAAVKNVSAATRDAFGTSGLFRNCEANDLKVYGVETTGEDVGMLHWVNTTGAQAVADDANFFKKVFCINNNEFNWYSKGADYTSVNQVPNYSRGGQQQQAGPISVSLAASNPASSTFVDVQSRAHLASFMFSGSGNVTNLKLKRIGVSADATLVNVYLYDGGKRLTDSATVSDGVITFNDSAGLFNATGGKVVAVMADMLDGTSGQTVGVQATSVNGAEVSVSGNLHTIADASLATVSVSTSVTPSANSALDPANDVNGWQDTVTVGTRYVWLKSVQFRVIGSVLPGDLRNFRLSVDGVQVGSAVAAADANGYIVFDVSGSPLKLETGGRVFKVMLDVVGGSGRNFKLSLHQASDIWAVDSQYNAGVLATGTFPTDAGQQTVAAGTLTITKKTDSPSGDIVKDASGVVLARYELKAQGERMKVEGLRVGVHYNARSDAALTLRNGALFADGVQVGSTAALCASDDTSCSGYSAGASASYTTYNLGSSLIVEPGMPRVLEVRADIYDSDGTNDVTADDTIQAVVQFVSGYSNVQRLTSLNYIDGPVAADQTGNTLTVKTGSMSVAKYTGYANQSVVTPKNGVKLGHFTLTAASSEDVNVNTIDITGDSVIGTDWNEADMTDMYIKVWNDAGSAIYTSPTKATVDGSASNSYSVNFTLPKSKTYQVEVWGNATSTDATALDSFTLSFDVTGITAGSSTTSNVSRTTGQTIAVATSALTVAKGSVPAARLINGGQTVAGVYKFTLTPSYDDFIVDEVYMGLASTSGTWLASTSGAVALATLKDGSTTLGSAVVNSSTASISFTGLNLSLPSTGGTKTLSVDVQYSSVGVGANDTAGKATLILDGLKYRDSAGSITTTTQANFSHTTYASNDTYVVKGYPTFTNVALGTSKLVAGSQTLFKTTLSATGGQVGWNNITFTIASSSAAGTWSSLQLWENGVNTGATASASGGNATINKRVEFTFATERVVSGGSSVTLELRGTVGGTLVAGETVTTNITNPKGSTVTTQDATVQQASGASFVWSDQSAPSHADTTADWFTDGLVKTIAESQALTY